MTSILKKAALTGLSLAALAAAASPAMAETWILDQHGNQVVKVKSCKWKVVDGGIEWQADFGSGFVTITNVICDGDDVNEGSVAPRDEGIGSATKAVKPGPIRYRSAPVIQPLKKPR